MRIPTRHNPHSFIHAKRSNRFSAFLKRSAILLALLALIPAVKAEKAIKVMSFNIRYGAADDGENHWNNRKELVIAAIRNFDPDLAGFQEVLGFQRDYLKEAFPEHEFSGVGRNDGKDDGEIALIMYRKSRFERTDAGHFWLSETPDIPGSKSWDSSLPRILCWVALEDGNYDGRPFVFGNTHWDHRGPQARLNSAKVIRTRMREAEEDGLPIILTGDFNCTEREEPYRILTQGLDEPGARLFDAYREIHPAPTGLELTFNGWQYRREGLRIDWILHTGELGAMNAAINYTQWKGRYPSDHYPVEAVLSWKRP